MAPAGLSVMRTLRSPAARISSSAGLPPAVTTCASAGGATVSATIASQAIRVRCISEREPPSELHLAAGSCRCHPPEQGTGEVARRIHQVHDVEQVVRFEPELHRRIARESRNANALGDGEIGVEIAGTAIRVA